MSMNAPPMLSGAAPPPRPVAAGSSTWRRSQSPTRRRERSATSAMVRPIASGSVNGRSGGGRPGIAGPVGGWSFPASFPRSAIQASFSWGQSSRYTGARVGAG